MINAPKKMIKEKNLEKLKSHGSQILKVEIQDLIFSSNTEEKMMKENNNFGLDSEKSITKTVLWWIILSQINTMNFKW